jgi:Na+-driven multidrug efflux pump
MSFRAEVGAMVRLALPIVVVQVGQMLMGVVDTIMVGHVSAGGSRSASRSWRRC